MSSWQEQGREYLQAAQLLRDAALFRSSVSRAYYSAYCAVTEGLLAARLSEQFRHRNNNPSHSQVIRMANQLSKLGISPIDIREIKSALRTLRRKREEADYMPGHAITLGDARTCMRFAGLILRTLDH